MYKNKLLIKLLSLGLLSLGLVACGNSGRKNLENVSQLGNVNAGKDIEDSEFFKVKSKEEIFLEEDYDDTYDSNSKNIDLSNLSSLSLEGVSVENNTVTISSVGTYVLTGKLEDGNIVINAKETDNVKLIFNGVALSSSTNTPIFVKSAKKVIFTIQRNTENTLSITKKFEESDENKSAVIFSKTDITFNGTGVLNISSPYGKGVLSNGNIVFIDGKYFLETSDHSVKAKNSLAVANGEYNIKAGDGADGLKADNDSDKTLGYVYIDGGKFEISVGDDGITGSSNVTIQNGDINILKSEEGIEGESVDIHGGNINVISNDDGINASSSSDESKNTENKSVDSSLYIRISGGKVFVNADGDGLDSNGNLYITGGETVVSGAVNNGDSSVDYDGKGKITGGTFLALGSEGMAKGFGETSTQGNILAKFSTQKKDTFKLIDQSGNVLLEYTPTKEYKAVVVSTKELEKDKKYTLVSGDETLDITLDTISYGNNGGHQGPPTDNKPGGMQRGKDPNGRPDESKSEEKK